MAFADDPKLRALPGAPDDDVALLKAQVAALELRVEAYQRVFEASPVGMAINGGDGRFIDVNPTGLRLFGMSREEVIGRRSIDLGLLVPESVERHAAVAVQIREQGSVSNAQRTIRAKSGELHDVALLIDGVELQGEASFVSTFLDITEQKRAVERLAASEAQLREAQEMAQVGSWDWDLRTDLVTRSAELRRIFGVRPEEGASGETLSYDHVHPDDRDRLRATRARAITDRQPYAVDYRVVRPDGVRFVHARGQVVCDAAGVPVRMFGTAQDVTDKRQLDERLVLAGRMASVGTLASGVAHEINNPLACVISNLELVAEELREIAGGSPSGRFRDLSGLIDGARQGAERVRKIVRGLKSLSRAADDRRALLDVRQVLDLSVNLAFNEIRHRAQLVRDYRDVPPVEADEARLGQVFINMLVNAAQAMPEGRADRNEIRLSTSTDAAGRAIVEVRDTGSGMSREVLDRVFDPFFTTKPVGVGTGLGLSICHGIVTALGGEIGVESAPGKGTLFRVALPPAQLRPAPQAEAPAPAVAGAKRGRVLIVDDDELVGSVFGLVLKLHDVTVLTDARDARDRLAAGERFDVILCDLMMPEMTGMELHAELCRISPGDAERMIFVTGGAFTPEASAFLDRVANERLDKPVDSRNLRAIVQRSLR